MVGSFSFRKCRARQWELGTVGNAEWMGFHYVLLERAGLEEDACEIVLEGADHGVPAEPPVPPGPSRIPESAPPQSNSAGSLIAYQMNGRDLTLDHGLPVRAIVPGHYGMASVKWLNEHPSRESAVSGLLEMSDYGYWVSSGDKPVRRAL